jgi:hypothetical protein
MYGCMRYNRATRFRRTVEASGIGKPAQGLGVNERITKPATLVTASST